MNKKQITPTPKGNFVVDYKAHVFFFVMSIIGVAFLARVRQAYGERSRGRYIY